MKKLVKYWQVAGFIFTGIGGVLLHFLYDWTDSSVFVAPFSAVNESIWEHMKLLFFPMFVFALTEYVFVGKDIKVFWCIKLAGILSGLILIPTIYYTYTGIGGINADWFNIIIFFISAVFSCWLENLIFKNEPNFCKVPFVAFMVLCFIGIAFVVMTFVQPEIPLFQDPVKGNYGVKN